jgi:hypothetical protein
MIQRFLWRLIGADKQVLARCPVQDRYSFSLAGAVVLLVLIITFFAFYGSCAMVFETHTAALFFAFLWSLALGNLYMLNLITIDSSSLPQRETTVSKSPALAIRVFMVTLLAIVISKLLELYLFGEVKHGNLLAGWKNMGSAAWFFTFLVGLIFLTPLYMKLTGLKATAYGNARREIEKAIVMENYLQFRISYEKLMLDSIGKPITYRERYTDPPFNTQKIIDTRMILGKGKLIEFLKKEKEEKAKNDAPPPNDPTLRP